MYAMMNDTQVQDSVTLHRWRMHTENTTLSVYSRCRSCKVDKPDPGDQQNNNLVESLNPLDKKILAEPSAA